MEYPALHKIGLDIPTVTKLMIRLRDKGWPVRQDALTLEEARLEIMKVLGGGKTSA